MTDDNEPRWDHYAAEYEAVHEPLTRQFAEAALEAAPVAAGERLLDIATGPGTLALLAARRGASVTGVDTSPRMIARFNDRLAEAGFASASGRVMDGARLDFADGSFDAVFCVFGIMLFADFRGALAEMARVTRPGGRAAVVMWNGLDRMEHVQVWLGAVAHAFPQFQPMPPPANWAILQEPASLARILVEAGFAEVDIRTARREWRVLSPAWFAARADLSPAAESLYRSLGPGARERVRRVLEEQLRARFGDRPFALAAEAHIARGTKPHVTPREPVQTHAISPTDS
jgi:ubiquinone/menaquinone biosynthesis C-methylase UbiE